ncbi:MAG: hypothetical protein HY581_01665 [Nitrospirae bacterium]|nr:hypothetical protein [Nitrospirota bacterium]
MSALPRVGIVRVGIMIGLLLLLTVSGAMPQEDPLLIFAVVTKVPKDRKQVTAQVAVGGTVTEATLIASDAVFDNLIWKKLEICHAIRAEAWKNEEGYRLVSMKTLDAGMLPMPLQGIAGDCLLKKALEFAPLVD